MIEPVEGVDIYSSLNDLWVFVTQMGIKIKDLSDETQHELKKLLKMIEQEHAGSLIPRVGHIEKQWKLSHSSNEVFEELTKIKATMQYLILTTQMAETYISM
mgnify:CR=1 FL=1